jgi:cellulose synthase/poly-beta-1,6-N-acetylglucosamine synthase-like glycosyltransferase
MWYSLYLPGLVASKAPIPLGGTSNHFRIDVLLGLGGWDPYNVTEDADLGIRLYRHGWRVEILESTTYEEANSDFVNWIKQRSRWYKGYLQTWAIHMRQPRQLWRELGPWGWAQFQVFVGGTPILTLLNPAFWATTLAWFIGKPAVIRETFPAPVFFAGLACWALGNFAVVYMTVLSTRVARQPQLILSALLSPLYWVMMAIAATKALLQLVFHPSHWEKTTHGLATHPAHHDPAQLP